MLNFKKLHITYADPYNHTDQIVVDYQLRDTPITTKWIERVLAAQQLYPIDDPGRFYGFGSVAEQKDRALADMNSLLNFINDYITVDKRLHSVEDQDTLNYLHHVFEVEHGLLDANQNNNELKQALCNLNLMVHRCESIARGAHPRHVVTYFGLPKTKVLNDDDYQYFESGTKFGTVYINYVEIGKTLYDLMLDNDSYINPEAFQPFCHYSADFVVRFWDDPQENLYNELYNYYQLHQQSFETMGYTWQQLSRSIGSIPVANLCANIDITQMLNTRQFVKAVDFS